MEYIYTRKVKQFANRVRMLSTKYKQTNVEYLYLYLLPKESYAFVTLASISSVSQEKRYNIIKLFRAAIMGVVLHIN